MNLHKLSENRSLLYGISAIWIVFYHMTLNFAPIKELNWGLFSDSLYYLLSSLKSLGSFGVDLFLVLSGISLYFAFSKDEKIGKFYKRRLLRILPTYFLCAIVFYLVVCWHNSKFDFVEFFVGLFGGRLLIYHENHLWFVPFIIVCYLLYPLIYKFLKNTKFVGFLALIASVVQFNLLAQNFATPLYSTVQIMTTRLPAFIIGCYLGKFVFEKKEIPSWLAWLAIPAFIIYFAAIYIFNLYGYGINKMNYGPLGLLFAVSICLIAKTGSKNILQRFFVWSGNYSFEMYLIFEGILFGPVNALIPQIDSVDIVRNLIAFALLLPTIILVKFLMNKFRKLFEKNETKSA